MNKTVRIALSIVLTFIMIISMFTVFSVSAETGKYVPYANANNGDLIFEADFRGIPGIWEPAAGWDGMKSTVSADGKSVTLFPSQDLAKNGRCCWGACLPTQYYTFGGNAYTVVFTVTAENDKQEVGFYPDWGTGFVIAPGMNRFRVGQWGNQAKIRGIDYYLGTGSLTQTYAVEFAGELGTSYPDNDSKCTAENLYVKIGNTWTLVYSLSAEVESKIAGKNELESMLWTINPQDYTDEVTLRFFRSPGDTNQTGDITISDLQVYKGLTIGASIAEQQTTTGGNIDLKSKEDGELLYKLNFSGDENFTPGALIDGLPVLSAKVDAADSGKVTVSVPEGENGQLHFWGGQIKGLPITETSEYTLFVTIERSRETAATDPVLGISADGRYYAVGDSSYIQLTKNGTGKVRSAVAYADNILVNVVGNHGADYGLTTAPFTQSYAIEIDGPNITSRAIRLYVLTDDGTYQLMSNSDSSSNIQFMNGNLAFYLYQKDANLPVTVYDAKIYKGRVVEMYNTGKLPGEAVTEEVTAEAGTEAPADTKTAQTNAPETAAEEITSEAANETSPVSEKKGCASAVCSGFAIVALTSAASALVVRKKKESDC